MQPSEDHVKIDSIKISLNGMVVELKLNQAAALWAQLDDLFGPRPAAPVWVWPQYDTTDRITVPMCTPDVMINPNAEPFPDHWVVGYNAYTGNRLEISL